jgi:hypothetical protein
MCGDWAFAEFRAANLWDGRCVASLARACDLLAEQAGVSLSRALGGGRKALSRLFHNKKATAMDLLSGHVAATVSRCQGLNEKASEAASEAASSAVPEVRPLVLVASDTSTLDFTSHKSVTGLGPTSDKKHTSTGFFVHSALALTPEGIPLGLLHQNSWARQPEKANLAKDRRKRDYAEKESHKWLDALRGVEAALPDDQPALLIQDMEADIFAFFAAPRQDNVNLLIRATQPRRVEAIEAIAGATEAPTGAAELPHTLMDAVAQAPVVATKVVSVHARPDREARDAQLNVRLLHVAIRAPMSGDQSGSASVPVWVVRASEDNPPAGVKEPIHWVLITTLPHVDAELAVTLTDYYALRWRIERFHYALKSGCGYEKLQCDTLEALQKALSLYSVVAWRLLWLTYLAREEPESPAGHILSEVETEVLERYTGKTIRTARDALQAVARIAGFVSVPSAPTPGLKSLWLGLRKLQDIVTGYLLATQCPPPKDMGQD